MGFHDNTTASSSTSSMSAINEATAQVCNLRERGKKYYFSGKSTLDVESLRMSVLLFKRGATYSASAPVAVGERLKTSKNYLAAFKLLQEVQIEHEDIERFDTNAFLEEYETIKRVYTTIRNSQTQLPASEYGEKWQNDVTHTYHAVVRTAVMAMGLIDSSDGSDLRSRTRKRVACLEQLLSRVDSHEDMVVVGMIRYGLVQVLLKASIMMNERRVHQSALECILQCETHIPYLQEVLLSQNNCNITSSILLEYEDLESLKLQVWYQRCACESSAKILTGYELFQSAIDAEGVDFDEGKILLSIDAFKEAQVLARETSLLQEAQASGRLALIFRCVPGIRDKGKSDVYYQHAFGLLETEEAYLQAAKLTEWGKDIMAERARIQNELAEKNDERKTPILEKHKGLLDRLRKKLGVECFFREDVADSLLFLYEEYPPTSEREEEKLKVKAKLDDKAYSSALRLAVSHYHPDRNREDTVGFEHHVLCEEITKMVNLTYSRLFKDL